MSIQGQHRRFASAAPVQPSARTKMVVCSDLRGDDAAVVSRVASALGYGAVCGSSALTRRAWPARGASGMVVVNIDAFADLGDAVDALVSFRRKHPAVKVIAVSRGFSSDDLGDERRAIADHCLKSPLGQQRVEISVRDLL